MIPVSFDGENALFNPPPGFEDMVEPISAFQGQRQDGTAMTVTCWKMTREELEEFQRTGRIWVSIFGALVPPMLLSGLKPIQREDASDEIS